MLKSALIHLLLMFLIVLGLLSSPPDSRNEQLALPQAQSTLPTGTTVGERLSAWGFLLSGSGQWSTGIDPGRVIHNMTVGKSNSVNETKPGDQVWVTPILLLFLYVVILARTKGASDTTIYSLFETKPTLPNSKARLPEKAAFATEFLNRLNNVIARASYRMERCVGCGFL